MKHVNCGGPIVEDSSKSYPYDSNDPDAPITDKTPRIPALHCTKCGKEIFGDAQIDLGPDYDL